MPRRLITAGTAILLSAGCAAPPHRVSEAEVELVERTAFWKPHRLYAAEAPYPKLHVEVDAVAGAEPTGEELTTLARFLERRTGSPGGVRVVFDDRISREEAEGRGSRSLGLEYIDGPPDETSAFIYVLYYDGKRLADPGRKPAAEALPYPCAIFIDRRYGPWRIGRLKEFDPLILRHEAGHVLGLCRNPAHAEGMHCTNEGCVMRARLTWSVPRLLTLRDPWSQRAPCPDCVADLERFEREPAPANLRFLGPFLVRSETEYHVLSLPQFVYVHFGALARLDHVHLQQCRLEALARDGDARGTRMYTSPLRLDDAVRLAALLEADPYDLTGLAADLRNHLE